MTNTLNQIMESLTKQKTDTEFLYTLDLAIEEIRATVLRHDGPISSLTTPQILFVESLRKVDLDNIALTIDLGEDEFEVENIIKLTMELDVLEPPLSRGLLKIYDTVDFMFEVFLMRNVNRMTEKELFEMLVIYVYDLDLKERVKRAKLFSSVLREGETQGMVLSGYSERSLEKLRQCDSNADFITALGEIYGEYRGVYLTRGTVALSPSQKKFIMKVQNTKISELPAPDVQVSKDTHLYRLLQLIKHYDFLSKGNILNLHSAYINSEFPMESFLLYNIHSLTDVQLFKLIILYCHLVTLEGKKKVQESL